MDLDKINKAIAKADKYKKDLELEHRRNQIKHISANIEDIISNLNGCGKILAGFDENLALRLKSTTVELQEFVPTLKVVSEHIALSEEKDDTNEEQVIGMLGELLLKEYLQRDLYETYLYWLVGADGIAIKDHIDGHIQQEMEHIEILHRYLTQLDCVPPIDRLPIPEVAPDVKSILEADLVLEKDAVESYSAAVEFLEGSEEYSALRVDLENILAQEQEHVQDIERWLREM